MSSDKNVTQILMEVSQGDQEALAKLMPLVYDELRLLAQYHLARERRDHTLQPTALVHEAYIKLIDHSNINWQSRAHFFGIAARIMRCILVDYARIHNAAKRGNGYKLSLNEAIEFAKKQDIDLIALDDALTKLSDLDPQQSRIVELRFFSGLSIEETAEILAISTGTVKREWRLAKAWLHNEMKRSL